MENLRDRALAIASKYSFKPFNAVATAEGGTMANVEPCSNHVDEKFMAELAAKYHLDVTILPLEQ